MTLEGVEVSKQEKGGLDFDYMTKREEPYQKPKRVRCNRSQRNIQKLKRSNDKRRKRKPKSGMKGLLVQAEAAGGRGTGPVGRVRKFQFVLWRNPILNPYQLEFVRS